MRREVAGVVERIQAGLDTTGLDGVILVSQVNVYYASGADVVTSRLLAEKPTFVVVPKVGESTVVVSEWDEDATRRDSRIEDVRSYCGNLAVPMVAEVILGKGLEACKLGIEERYLRTADYKQLVLLLPRAELLPCDELMQELRAIKTLEEVELLRQAAVCAEKAIYATFATARPGVTEEDMADQLVSHLRRFRAVPQYVTAKVNTGILHLPPSEKQIAHGEVMRLDVAATLSGYWSDISRNAIVGQPTPQQRSTYRGLWEIRQRIIEKMEVGARACDVYRLYQQLSEERGFPEPLPSIGHAIGLEVQERPVLDSDDDTELDAGMVFAVEPITAIPGDARYDIEDMVLVTEEGAELLSAWQSIEDMFVIE